MIVINWWVLLLILIHFTSTINSPFSLLTASYTNPQKHTFTKTLWSTQNRHYSSQNLSIVFIYMSYSCVVCQRGVSRGGTRGVGIGAGEGAGSGRGSVRRCWSGIPHRASAPLSVEPRGKVQEPLAKRAGGGMPDVAFCGQNML